MAVDSPSDLLVLLGTMTLVAKVVVNARVQLNYRAMEVRSLSHSRRHLGSGGQQVFTSGHICPLDITVGCQMADRFRICSPNPGPSLLLDTSVQGFGMWRRPDM